MEKQVANSTDNKDVNTENTNDNRHEAGDKFNSGIDEKFEKDKKKPLPLDMDADKEMEDEGTGKNKLGSQKSRDEKPSYPDKEIKKTEKAPPY